MGFIFIIPLAALAIWIIFSVFRWLRRAQFGEKWWRAFGVLGMVGIVVGIWFAFFMHYKVANVRLERFPIPARFYSQEKPDGDWKESNMPTAIRIGAIVTDFLSGIAICLVPIAVGLFFKENTGKGPFARSNSP